ncbi:oligosaccharide flippase family protein [Mycobacterium sp.]|uniref:oligosaccharide flippase family protein n=1 Tax=Mycobacterium sp. TaxID=1785 RepID=UPI003F9E607E
MSRVQAGAGELAKAGPEGAGPRTPLETEPWTETTADLTNVLKRGAGMAAIGLVIVQIVTVAQTLVLGRLLGPHEVGIFAAGTVMTGVIAVFAQNTLSHALIQREHDIEDAANTVLIVTCVTGLLLALAVLVASPLIGALFHDSRVGLIAAASSGIMLLHSCPSVPDALMQRTFQFKRRRVIIDPAMQLTFASVSIVFAVFGYGAWAMVIGTYASATTWVLLSWWMAKWRPFRGRFSFRIWRELAGFSLPLLLDGIAERSRDMVQQVLVGRAFGTAGLGQFKYGSRIAFLPGLAVVQICGYVLFPAFSRISGDGTRFRQAFLRALGWIWLAALPVGALLLAVGQPVVVLLLGEKWRAAGAAASAMAGVGLGAALASVAAEAVKGAGRSRLLNWLTAINVGLGLPLLVLLLPFGLVGVGVALSVTYMVCGFVTLVQARSVVGVSVRDTIACVMPPTLSALIALGVVMPLERFVVRSDQHPALLGLASIIAECVLFSVVYIGALRLISPTWYGSIRDVVVRVLAKLADRARRSM